MTLVDLHKGVWDGKQVLSSTWVEAATSSPKDADFDDYGYLWWLNSYSYSAQGRGGQRIYVLPDKDMVAVLTGGGGKDYWGVFEEQINKLKYLSSQTNRPVIDLITEAISKYCS